MHQLYHSTFMTSTSFCFLPWASNELSVRLLFQFHPSCLLSPFSWANSNSLPCIPLPWIRCDIWIWYLPLLHATTSPRCWFVVINPLNFFFLIKAIAIASRCFFYTLPVSFSFSRSYYDMVLQHKIVWFRSFFKKHILECPPFSLNPYVALVYLHTWVFRSPFL